MDAERLRRKRQLAASLRIFHRLGFAEGAGGHVTARDPEHPSRFWVNALGRSFATARVRDLLLVDADGEVLAGEGRVNPAGFAIHSRLHRARPDVVAAAHAHSVHGVAWSTLGRPLDPISQDACAFHHDHAVFDQYTGVVLDPAEGDRIAACLGGRKAVVLRNHGLLTVGGSVAEAAWWFVSMDRCCRVQLLAEAAGTPVPIDEPAAVATARVMGTPGMGVLNFKPLYAEVVHREPDLLD
ncbi:class II aldolase/adducin family protein [Actinosynnema sp. NPDC020468]|uniref:class II aldolase/adducin family protein n=1 Tax=Actinosynnema sp. NPDC020468 TaxID=3154488 RepID=UPI0033E87D4F